MITYGDKLLPTQPFFSDGYKGKDYVQALAFVCDRYAVDLSPAYLDIDAPKSLELQKFSSSLETLSILRMLISLHGVKTVLEVGTLVGTTTIQLARMVGTGGKVVTVEIGEDYATYAQKNFAANETKAEVVLHCADAVSAMKSMVEPFDLIFLDGGKQDYPVLASEAERLLSERGLLVIDDVFFHGDALNLDPATDKGRGCKAVLEHYRRQRDWCSCLLPVGNGLLILWRKGVA